MPCKKKKRRKRKGKGPQEGTPAQNFKILESENKFFFKKAKTRAHNAFRIFDGNTASEKKIQQYLQNDKER